MIPKFESPIPMSKTRLTILILVLVLIFLIPFNHFLFFPVSVFRGLELKPDGRLLSRVIEEESKKKDRLDVLFLARSSMQSAINAVELETRLSTEKRKIKIFIAGIRIGDTYSALRILETFLQNRKIGSVIMSDDFLFTPPQLFSALIFRKEDLTSVDSKMNLFEKLELYRARILAAPILLRELILPISISPKPKGEKQIESYVQNRGTIYEAGQLFKDQKTPNRVLSKLHGKPLTYSELLKQDPSEGDYVQYIDNNYSMYFFKQIIRIANENEAKLYLLRDIRYNRPSGQGVVFFHPEGEYAKFNKQFEGNLSVSMERLFEGVDAKDVSWYFSSIPHLNLAGNRLFTDAIAPVIKEVIEEAD